MNILALDLATRTGWASSIAGANESGVVTFLNVGAEPIGMRFARFNFWLYKWQTKRLDIVVYEQAHQRGRAATEVAIGMSTRVQEFCARHGVKWQAIHSSTIKKFATGSGRAEKPAMIRAAQALKAGVGDDNEADALWILEFTKSKFGVTAAVK